ncbi:MAG TPA: hypothetical protein VNI82_00050 [Candidatus Nitrosotenuis sp.]|nr:hypothetical protein [Candidatus Nitrosotenuis sp.]
MTDIYLLLAQVQVDADQIGLPQVKAGDDTFNLIVGLVYTLIGAVALFYIVRGALLYVASGSDPSSVKDARETILYAIVALGGATVVFGLIQFVAKEIG